MTLDLRSRLFSTFPQEHQEDLKRDFRALLALDEAKRPQLLLAASEFAAAPSQVQVDTALDLLVERLGLSRAEALRHISFVMWFVRQTFDEARDGDTPELWAADLQTLGVIDVAEIENTLGLLRALARASESAGPEIRKRQFSAGVLPSLLSVRGTVELRAVPDRGYRWGESVDAYAPRVVDLTKVFSVAIELDSSQPSDLYFQVTEPALEMLISYLESLRRDAQALDAALKHRPK